MVTGRSAAFLDQAWTLCWHIPQTPVWSHWVSIGSLVVIAATDGHSYRWTHTATAALLTKTLILASCTNTDITMVPLASWPSTSASSSSPLQPCFFHQQMNCPDFLSFFPISILYLLNIMVPKLCLPSKFPHRPRSGKWLVAVLIGVLILYKWWLLGIMCWS